MKPKTKTPDRTTYPEVELSSTPPTLLEIVRSGNAGVLGTRDLNCFYVFVDQIEKRTKALKDQCRSVIIARRDEGEVSGSQSQHRKFTYELPTGNVELTIQERLVQRPDPQKLEALLKEKDLWEQALTTTVDPIKIDGMRVAGLITQDEYDAVSETPRPTYALIAKLEKT